MLATPLTNLQALAIAAVAQLIAVAVALLWITPLQGQIIASAAGAVIALLVGLYQVLETQKAIAQIHAASVAGAYLDIYHPEL